jgi:hypothetical protein
MNQMIQILMLKHLKKIALCLIASMALITACQNVASGADGATADALGLYSKAVSDVNASIPISDADELALIGTDIDWPLSGYYVLTASFPVTDWIPIGLDTSDWTATPFTGTFDGAGNTITISSFDDDALAGSNYLGIFATTNGALIQNLTVYLSPAITDTSAQYIGGVVGSARDTTFVANTVGGVNLILTTTGTANSTAIGGLAGYAILSTFLKNTVSGAFTVTSNDAYGSNIGGLVGQAFGDTFTGDITDSGITVTINSSGISNSAVGGIAGTADRRAQFSNISATANVSANYANTNTTPGSFDVGGVTGDSEGATYNNIKVGGTIKANASMPFNGDYTDFNFLAVGGAIGYANGGSITDSASSAAISAESDNTASVAGGLVGRGETTSIASSALLITNGYGTGSVASTGGQTPASAAGIAGYITNTTITNTHTTAGTITASAPSGSGQYDVYQAYAAGLVGYSGNSSTITLSSSTGQTVVANNAAYPYSGGLVAYQYGYNDFTNPPSNGSVTTQSYSTNTVTATATTNGLPYAGGLVAYSSVIGSLVENSFATGDVTGTTTGNSAWVGGLIGSNAQSSVVSWCYATGTVTSIVGSGALPYGPQPGANPGAAGGGIAGTCYYTSTATVPINYTTVQYCAALNRLITGSAPATADYLLHRVVGDLGVAVPADDIGLGRLYDNIANEDMSVTPVWNYPDRTPNGLDGADAAAQPSVSDYIALTWDFNTIWAMGANGYPSLLGNP